MIRFGASLKVNHHTVLFGYCPTEAESPVNGKDERHTAEIADITVLPEGPLVHFMVKQFR